MTLLHPEQLVWGLLAIPLILLAVWQRSQQHAVSSNHIWDAVLAERTWFERARRPLALALSVASVELLVFAAADPRLNSTDADIVVLVVDVSASMKATVTGGTRFDQARALARRSIDELPPGQRMALLSAGSVTQVACDLTGDRNRLRAALDAIRPTDGTADLVAAIALAEDLIPNARRGRIIVATDGTPGPSEARSPAANVEWTPIGDAADNVGITRCEIRPRLANPAELELLVEVLNAGSATVSCPLEIDFRGQAVDRSTLAIAAGKSLRKFKSIDNAEGGLLTIRLNHADALAADNVAAVQVPERRRTRITLVTSGNRAAQAALASLPGVDVTVTGEAPEAGPPPDLLIWDGQVPARLPSGPNMVLAPSTNCDLWKLGTVSTGSVVVRDQVESPSVAHVDFTQAVLEDPIQLDFNLPVRSLVSSADGVPIYSLCSEPATRRRACAVHVGIEEEDRFGRAGYIADLVCRRLAFVQPAGRALRAGRHDRRHGFDFAGRNGPPPAAAAGCAWKTGHRFMDRSRTSAGRRGSIG